MIEAASLHKVVHPHLSTAFLARDVVRRAFVITMSKHGCTFF